MCDNLLKNMDSGQINCIVFFDVRRAFDSINHEILIDKMRNLFGVTGNQLRWFKSYLNNRVQQCLINGQLSSPKKIICGVPQGSILGPLLFLLT
jgi:retron-type reverse transcriptase